MLKHILFDNDGTLVDSEIIAVRSTLALLRGYGFEMSEQEYSHQFPGLLERDILAIIQRDYGIVVGDDYLTQLRAAHIAGFEKELRVIPGVDLIFRQLQVPKSIVSNASRRHVEQCLRHVGLHDALDGHIFSAEQVEQPKPHPAVYLLALQQLGLHPSETMVVEDSPVGVAAAKSAGLQVVGFLGAAHIFDGHAAKLQTAGADYIAADATALTQIFRDKKVF